MKSDKIEKSGLTLVVAVKNIDKAANLVFNLNPVSVPHGVVLQVSDERHGPLELVDLTLRRFDDFPLLVLKSGSVLKMNQGRKELRIWGLTIFYE